MAGFPVGTQGGLKPGDASALMQRLRQSAPAQNPGTPVNRLDTTTERLQSCNQVRVCLEKLMTTINEDEPQLKAIVIGMHAATTQMLAGVEPQTILATITTKLGQANGPAAPTPQPGQSAGMPGNPSAPGMPNPQQGVSPGPQAPVSPGPPG
jgi:hypothetical protein